MLVSAPQDSVLPTALCCPEDFPGFHILEKEVSARDRCQCVAFPIYCVYFTYLCVWNITTSALLRYYTWLLAGRIGADSTSVVIPCSALEDTENLWCELLAVDIRDSPSMLMWWLDFFLQLIRQLFSVLCSLQSSHYTPHSLQFLTWKVGQVGSDATGREEATYRAELQGAFGEDWRGSSGCGAQSLMKEQGRRTWWWPSILMQAFCFQMHFHIDCHFWVSQHHSWGFFLPLFSDTGSVEHTGRRFVPEVSSRDRREVHTL